MKTVKVTANLMRSYLMKAIPQVKRMNRMTVQANQGKAAHR